MNPAKNDGPNVEISSFPVTLSREEAMVRAAGKGGPLGRLMLMGKKIHDLRLHFVEYRILLFEVFHSPDLISRFLKGETGKKKQFCRVIANGTTGGVAWAEEIPEVFENLSVSESRVQVGEISLDQLTGKGHKLVLRVLRRRIGGLPQVFLKESFSVYRPFYVALYGEPIEGTKIRYLPIAADGWGNHRTF